MPGYSRVVEWGERHVRMWMPGRLVEGGSHVGGMPADAGAVVAGDDGDGETVQIGEEHVHEVVDSVLWVGSMCRLLS